MPLSNAQLAEFSNSIATAFADVQTKALEGALSQQMPLIGAAYFASEAAGVKGFAELGAQLKAAFDQLSASPSEAQVESKIEQALGGVVNATVTVNGNDVQVQLTHSKTYNTFSVDIQADAALAGLGLEFRAAGSVSSDFAYGFDVTFGVDGATPSFYIAPKAGAPELALSIDGTTPGLSLETQLGFLLFNAQDAGSRLHGSLSLELNDPSGEGRLRLDELASGNFFTAQFNGDARLYLDLAQTNANGDPLFGDTPLPEFSTGLRVDWPLVAAAMTPGGATTTFGGKPTVRFEDVSLDVGTFASNFLKPALLGVQDFIAPVSDLVSFVTTPIGFLQEIGVGNVSALDIAESLNLVAPPIAAGIRAAGAVLETIAALPEDAESVVLNFGDHQFGSTVDFRRIGEALAAQIPAGTGGGGVPGQLSTFLQQSSQSSAQTMKFPIVEDPTQVLKLLLGREDAQLFTYTIAEVGPNGGDLPAVKIPVFPPVVGNFGLGVDFGANLSIGYDTYGLRQWIDNDFENPALILDGLYVRDYAGPEFLVGLRAAVGVAIDVLVAEAGFSGGFNGHLELNLNDPNLDGRVHLDEIFAAGSPYDLFGASGSVNGFFEAYFDTIFTKKKAVKWEFELFDFAKAKAKAKPLELPVPPLLASAMDLDGNGFPETAVLHMGQYAGLRGTGTKSLPSKDVAEAFHVAPPHESPFLQLQVVVNSRFGPDVVLDNVGRIFADGGKENDEVLLADYMLLSAELRGGPGEDRLQGGGGDDLLAGGSGFDMLFGGAGVDYLYAEEDGAFLDGGTGADYLIGGTGNDVLKGGPGEDFMFGGDGDDTFYVDNAADVATDLTFFGSVPSKKGIDTVIAAVSYTLEDGLGGATIENLTLIEGVVQGFGNSGNNTILGNDRDNILRGNAGDDILYGNTGDDFIAGDQDAVAGSSVDDGDDQISGSAGNDELHGEGGIDFLDGGPGSDVLDGGPGNDDLNGGSGNDFLDGGEGLDFLEGGPGDDTYYVDFKADQIIEKKNQGTDSVTATVSFTLNSQSIENLTLGIDPDGTAHDLNGTGNHRPNQIIGNAGKNVLNGMDGDDELFGVGGDDSLFGGKNDDILHGGTGDDELFGGAGADILDGGNDNDRLDGGPLSDEMRGGPGDDTYIVSFSTNIVVLDEVIEEPGAGTDTVATKNPKYTLPANVENLIYTGTANGTLLGTSGPNLLLSGPGNDTLDGAGGLDTLAGGKGKDTYRIDGADDQILELPKEGIDEVIVAFSGYVLPENLERLKLEGFASTGIGNDADNRIEGNAFANILIGGGGFDTLIGGAGNDILAIQGTGKLDGGAGDDIYEIDSEQTGISDISGIDHVFSHAPFYNLPKGIENLTLSGPEDRNGGGNSGANRLTGNSAINTLRGFDGNDILLGEDGNDTLRGDDDNDQLYGGLGMDTLLGGEGDDLLFGYDLNGTPTGDAASGAPDQQDTLKGGLDDDYYYIGGALDVVVELQNQGIDTVESRISYALPTHVENLILGGLNSINGNGNLSANRIEGNSAANFIFGDFGKDLLIGAGGPDILRGGGDFDTLDGGSGDDELDGGPGTDTLKGGDGNDTYRMEDSVDVIVEAVGEGIDEVFALLGYTLPVNVENLTILEPAGTEKNGTGNDIANVITGNSGNNVLKGKGGNDLLIGNDGGDTLDGGEDADTMRGGLGDDLYRVDHFGDIVDEIDRVASGGTDTVQSTIDYTLPSGIEKLTLVSPALIGSGNSLANIIAGNALANVLKGTLGDDSIDGREGADDIYGSGGGHVGLGEKDVVTGGPGADRFFLFEGGSPGPHYHDTDAASAGYGDYLRITDFTPAEGDRLQYAHNAGLVILAPTTVDGFSGLGLWMDQNDNDILETTGPAPDEFLALLDGYNPQSIPPPTDIIDFYAF